MMWVKPLVTYSTAGSSISLHSAPLSLSRKRQFTQFFNFDRFIYLYLVRLFAGPIVWASIFLSLVGFIVLGFWLNNYAKTRPE